MDEHAKQRECLDAVSCFFHIYRSHGYYFKLALMLMEFIYLFCSLYRCCHFTVTIVVKDHFFAHDDWLCYLESTRLLAWLIASDG